MKKIFIMLLMFSIFPFSIKAYNIDTKGMNSDIAKLLKELEEDWPNGLDEGRLEVVRQAGLLIGKGTKYVWGGGHNGLCAIGVPYGLDCSGYVSLMFNRAGVKDVACGWTTADFATTSSFYNISESNLRPGDIALNYDTTSENNHVGIFVGRKNGQNIWFHSSTYNGVSGPQVRYGNVNFAVFKSYSKWNEIHVSGTNSGIGGELGGRLDDPYYNMSLNSSNDFKCENIFYTISNSGVKEEKTFKKILDGVFNAITLMAPVIAIVLTVLVYFKIITNSNSDSIKKANVRMIKRMIIAIIIAFLPFLLQLLFNIFGLYDLSNCGIS